MSKFIDWVKEHVRPYVKLPNREGDFPQYNEVNKPTEEKISDDIKNTEVGIKLTWKW